MKMKDYQSLTLTGKIRRFRNLVIKALAHYDFQWSKIVYLGWFTNLLFKLTTQDGNDYVVRVCAPNWRTDQDAQAEGEWLEFLNQEGTIQAPVPLRSKSAAYFIYEEIEGIHQPMRISVQSFLPGRRLGKALTVKNLIKMGELFATMHQASLKFKPSKDFPILSMNKVLARGEPDQLFCADTLALYDPESLQVYLQIRDLVVGTYQRRYQHLQGLRVIHHDLWHDNIHIHRGKLYPLDFEDTVLGFPIQDIAMAMQDLMKDVPAEKFDPLLNAFREGYEGISPWPALDEEEMDIFRLGRMLWVSNYVALKQPAYFTAHAKESAVLFNNFLNTGKLRKIPE